MLRRAGEVMLAVVDPGNETPMPRQPDWGGESGRGLQIGLRAHLLHLDHDRRVPEPAGDLGRGRGGVHHRAVQRAEVFTFPAGIGPVECVNVEHEEVLLMPRWVEAQRVTFKYGLGSEFIGVLQTLHKLGLDSTDPVQVGSASVSPRDVVAACLPDPAGLGDKMSGLTCAGTWVTGTGTDGSPREVYLYHVVDNAWSMAEYGSQAVVWQTAVNPVVALELIDAGAWSGAGVLGPEALPPRPFLDLLNDYGAPGPARSAPPPRCRRGSAGAPWWCSLPARPGGRAAP